jgi:hypothetical protein
VHKTYSASEAVAENRGVSGLRSRLPYRLKWLMEAVFFLEMTLAWKL